jgi:transposase
LALAEGIEDPTDEQLRQLDRKRKGKKVSNQDWVSPTDPDSRITKMKDGRTHLAYKAEHAVDLETEAIVATTVLHADRGDAETGPITLTLAEANVVLAGCAQEVTEAVMDKGYHDNRLLADCSGRGIRTYIPEREQKTRRWTDKPAAQKVAFRANRRRVRGERGRRLSRWRSERCERTFAHICETGGGRRVWVRGRQEASKLYLIKCAAYNLGLLLRKVWGLIKPRGLAGLGAGVLSLLFGLWSVSAVPAIALVLISLVLALLVHLVSRQISVMPRPTKNRFFREVPGVFHGMIRG